MAKGSFSLPIIIIAIFSLGLLLRLWGGWQNTLFTYDQARDLFISQEILGGDLKIVGPSSDSPGVFHGPLYYYFLAPFSKNVAVATIALAIFNLLAIIPLYFLAKSMFKNNNAAVIACFLYAISFEMVNYGRWLSNPALAIPFYTLYIFGLWQLVEKNPKGWIFVAIGAGFCIQAQLFMLYLIGVTVLFYLLYHPKLHPAIFIFPLFLLSFVIAEIKFGFQGLTSLLTFFYHQNQNIDIPGRVFNYLSYSLRSIQNNILPQSNIISAILLIPLLRISKETFFLYFLLISHILVFIVSKTTLAYISVGIGIVILLLAVKAISLNKCSGAFLLAIITIGNLWATTSLQPKIISLFKVQPNMSYKNEVKVVDKVYQLANNQQFSISVASNPYRTPTLWFYLFSQQKNPPIYHGLMAYDFAGKNALPISDKIYPTEFFIIEPGLDERLIQIERDLEDRRTKTVEKFLIDEFLIEKRTQISIDSR